MLEKTKGEKRLEMHCKRFSYKKPKYAVISKISEKYPDYYEVMVEVEDQLKVNGYGMSKRMARNNAAIKAFKELQFKKCEKSCVSELIQFCERFGSSYPVFNDECDGHIYRVRCKVWLGLDSGDLQLLGTGYSDSYKMAKTSAANDVIQQLKDNNLFHNQNFQL